MHIRPALLLLLLFLLQEANQHGGLDLCHKRQLQQPYPQIVVDYYPPGGFMNFLQTGQPFIPHVSAPWPPIGKESQLAPNVSGNQNAKNRSKGKTSINLDDGARTAKRLVFDPDEDERLVSAWLIHSNDPINGNCKKNERYWGDVHELYAKGEIGRQQ